MCQVALPTLGFPSTNPLTFYFEITFIFSFRVSFGAGVEWGPLKYLVYGDARFPPPPEAVLRQ